MDSPSTLRATSNAVRLSPSAAVDVADLETAARTVIRREENDRSDAAARWTGRPIGVAALCTALAAALAAGCLAVFSEADVCGDYICFHAAGTLIARGESPYDATAERELQRRLGWDELHDGNGRYAFMPFFYPPWVALAFAPFAMLGFRAGKLAWLVAEFDLLLLAGYLLRDRVRGLPRAIPLLLVPCFALSAAAALFGQTSPLVLLLVAAAWRLLDKGRDRAAGITLALLTFKPQLTLVLVPAALVWAARRSRWGILVTFSATLLVLAAGFLLLLPDWPLAMVRALAETPRPTDAQPWFGTTWLLLLRSFGLAGWSLRIGYLAAALPAVLAVARAAWSTERPVADVLGLSLLAVLFVAPYAQAYDFPVLLVPALVLLGTLRERAATGLLLVLLIVPYLHLRYASAIRLWWLPTSAVHAVTLMWLPVLLVSVWALTRRRQQPLAH